MSPHDQHRFAEFIDQFIDSCGIVPPFHLVAISENGSISVAQYGDGTVEEVGSHTAPGGFTAPLVVTIIAPDGRSR